MHLLFTGMRFSAPGRPSPKLSVSMALPVMLGNTNSSNATSAMRFRMTRAGADGGTRCCLPAFMRSAGTVQIAAALSISPSLRDPRVTRSSGRENQKLERETADASVLPSLHQRRQLAVGRRGEVAIFPGLMWQSFRQRAHRSLDSTMPLA